MINYDKVMFALCIIAAIILIFYFIRYIVIRKDYFEDYFKSVLLYLHRVSKVVDLDAVATSKGIKIKDDMLDVSQIEEIIINKDFAIEIGLKNEYENIIFYERRYRKILIEQRRYLTMCWIYYFIMSSISIGNLILKLRN